MIMEMYFSILEKQSISNYMKWKMNKVVSSEVMSCQRNRTWSSGRTFSKERSVEVLICGGLGGGAQAALAEAGIEVCSGAKGDTDQAVEAYLKGELVSTGVNCDHHHEEGHSCGQSWRRT